ncbi:MAG: transporter [Kangiella sp.]|nr:MAG: transporter [Kangiella sp.]
MDAYIPWYYTAVGLALVTLGFSYALGKALGVSGSWARLVTRNNDREVRLAEASFIGNPKLFEDALMAATIREFGEQEVSDFLNSRQKKQPKNEASQSNQVVKKMPSRVPWSAHLTFLIFLALGGVLGSMIRGTFSLQFDLGDFHTQMFGGSVLSLIVLLVGGLMVGFGTQLGGGCTSGHGLSGVSRLTPASLIATGCFFGAAIIFSFAFKFFVAGGGI